MKKFIKINLILFLLMVGTVYPQSQNFVENVSKRGTTIASFLEVGVSARALGMGSAFTAMANDASAIFYNVAGIAKMNHGGIFFNHSQWIADTRFDYLAGVFPLGRMGTFGISLTALTMDEMDVTTVENPEGDGRTFGAGDYALSLAYAFKLTPDFAIGFNPKIIHQFIWDMSATGIAIDVGVHYNTPFKNVILGFSMSNFGPKMSMNGDNSRVLYDFDPESSGNNDRVTALLETDKWSLPLNFKIGLVYELLKSAEHKAFLAVDAMHPNNDYESVNIGAEYTYRSRFSLRGGYQSLFLDGSEESFTLGMGVNYPLVGRMNFHFDFAYADFGRLENVQKYSIGIDF